MQKLVVISLIIAAIGCSKSVSTSKFMGTWSGTYSSTIIATNPPDFDTGTLRITVDGSNNATATLHSLYGGFTTIMKGTVNPLSGAISTTKYGQGDYGLTTFLEGLGGNISGGSASGTLSFPWATTSSWQAVKN